MSHHAPEHHPGEASALARFLAERDVPCPSCGYNLRGLDMGSCPECNQELMLRVGLAEPRLGIYITGLIGWALGAGLNALMYVFVASVVLRFGVGGGDLGVFLVYNTGAAIIQGAGLVAWIRYGPRIRRLGLRPRLALAATGWVVSLINGVVFALVIE